jgi:ribosomal-protein-alanine N-acetyltransferase
MRVPVLDTPRLWIREFTLDDLRAVHQLLDLELGPRHPPGEAQMFVDERRRWLQWTVLSYGELDALRQPPYGDRAVVAQDGGDIIGACGYVPCLAPFAQIPGFAADSQNRAETACSAEVGLYWAISPRHQRRGYATEAARGLVDYARRELNLRRLVAMTDSENAASIGVMRRIGMRVEHNPLPEPAWLQVVGVLEPLA